MDSEPSDPATGLYVHVPLCTDKCLYCDFYSVPRSAVPLRDQEELVRQIGLQASTLLSQLEGSVRTIFVGGGTPSALPGRAVSTLLRSLPGAAAEEWTVEANPETIDAPFLEACRESGVTRLSVGVQSTDDRLLATLRRRARRADVERTLKLLDSSWGGELSFDLITGIPGQKPTSVVDDIGVLAGSGCGHFSLYQLTCEPDTPLARSVAEGTIRLNEPEQDEELWFAGVAELRRRGFQHYEISNFCREGKECRHNLRYWRMEPYLGVGPAAVSTLPAARVGPVLRRQSATGILRLTNPRSVTRYLQGAPALWGIEVEEIAPRDFLLETLMMGLRLKDGLEARGFHHRFGADLDELAPGVWNRWVSRGLALRAADRLALTDSGRFVLDGLLIELANDLQSRELSGLSVSWP
ncbi:MAG TPA: coproporphyrinogen-III oxidase family protein [Spirochaetia bacterium]|nr:coproporphyrinogen-III oxidase family protein [Spirochaetia bacterium]